MGLLGAVVPTVIRSEDGLNLSNEPLITDAEIGPVTFSDPVIDVLPLSIVDPVTINPDGKLINPENESAYEEDIALLAVPNNDPVIPLNPPLLPDTTSEPVITAFPSYGNPAPDTPLVPELPV